MDRRQYKSEMRAKHVDHEEAGIWVVSLRQCVLYWYLSTGWLKKSKPLSSIIIKS